MTGRVASCASFFVVLCSICAWVNSAAGGAITQMGCPSCGEDQVFDDDRLLNPAATYIRQGGGVMWVFPGTVIKEHGISFTPLDGSSPFPAGGGAWAVDSFFDITYEITFEVNGVPNLTATGTGGGHMAGGSTAMEPDVFLLTMDQFDISGTIPTDPPTPFLLRESPTDSSTGETTLTDIGGGQFQIDSFFDIFTELSLDGGQTWVPATAQVPEPSSLVLMSLSGLAALSYRRRR